MSLVANISNNNPKGDKTKPTKTKDTSAAKPKKGNDKHGNDRKEKSGDRSPMEDVVTRAETPIDKACSIMKRRDKTYPVLVPELVRLVKDNVTLPTGADFSNDFICSPLLSRKKVLTRSFNPIAYKEQVEVDRPAKYQHHLDVQKAGFFTQHYESYREFGPLETDHRALFLKFFDQNLPLKFIDKLASKVYSPSTNIHKIIETTKDGDFEKKFLDELFCDLNKEERGVRDSGLSLIKEWLKELRANKVSVRGGHSYYHHLLQCLEQRKEAAERLEEKEEDMQLIKLTEIDLDTLIHQGMIPIRLNNKGCQQTSLKEMVVSAKLNNFTRVGIKKWRKSAKRNLYMHKLEYVHHLLCSLCNLKSRYLKATNTLPVQAVMKLRKDPFQIDQSEDKFERLKFQEKGRCRGGPSHLAMVPHMNDVLAPLNTVTEHHQEEEMGAHPDMKKHVPSDFFTSQNLKKKQQFIKRKSRLFSLIPANEMKLFTKTDTWEDFLNAGVKNNKVKVKKPVPPWQASMDDPSHLIKNSKDLADGKMHMLRHHTHQILNMHKARCLVGKKHMVKVTKNQLEKLRRSRVIDYKLSMASTNRIHPAFLEQKKLLADAHQRAFKDPSLKTDTKQIPWFDALVKEGTELECVSDPDIEVLLKKLEDFLLEDFTSAPEMKQKLCMICISLPINEICTPHVQQAVQFVLTQVLEASEMLFEEWQKYRKLYVLKTD